MNFFKYTLLAFSISNFAFAMENIPEYSVQDFLDSKPNYQICMMNECNLESLPGSKAKFTSLIGIANVDAIKEMHRINLDNNCIRLIGSPFLGLDLKCQTLSLNRNEITSLNLEFFKGLTYLKRLEIACNMINHIPEEFRKSLPEVEIILGEQL